MHKIGAVVAEACSLVHILDDELGVGWRVASLNWRQIQTDDSSRGIFLCNFQNPFPRSGSNVDLDQH